MFIKRISLLLAIFCLCFLNACGQSSGEETLSPAVQDDLMGDYQSLLDAYNSRDVNVTVTLTVDSVTPLENRFSLRREAEGYTVTDLSDSDTVTYGEDVPQERVYKVAGYLPPYESAYPEEEGVYSSRMSGSINLEMLLGGSNLFDGYSSQNVSLDGECVYIANTDGGIRSYSYEFAVKVNDGTAQFPAKIKYLIEVNE